MYVAPDPKVKAFFHKAIRTLLIIIGMLLGVLIYGTIGFYILEGASPFDSFYMTVITMTTVGFGEHIPLSFEGRIFAVTSIFLGLLGSGVAIALVTNLIFQETMLDVLKARHMHKVLNELKDHYIICGCGTTGQSIVELLLTHNQTVVVIDQKPIPPEIEHQVILVEGDARNDEVLKRARIDSAAGLATTLTEDADNVFVTLTARSLNAKIRLVSRYKDDDTEKKLIIAGADQSVSPYRMGGQRLALALTNPAFHQVLDASMQQEGMAVRFAHVDVPEASFLNDLHFKELDPHKYTLGALIVAVVDQHDKTVFNPNPDLKLDGVKRLIVLGDEEQIQAVTSYVQE